MTWQAWFFVAVDCVLAFVLGRTVRGARRRVRELIRRNRTQARDLLIAHGLPIPPELES